MAQKLEFKLGLKTQFFRTKLKQASAATKNFGAKANRAFKKIGSTIKQDFNMAIKSSIVRIAALVIGIHKLSAAVAESARNMLAVGKAFREVNSLLDGPKQLNESTKKAIELQSNLYGSDKVANIKAYYDIISSGIIDQTKALEVLNESNKLAIATVSDQATAADVLTTVMNSYGHETYEASKLTDILVQTIKKGKLRLPELAQSLGRVSSMASNAGVSFEELSAVIAHFTARGLKVPQALTAIRALLTSLIRKEGKDAKGLLEELGFGWDLQTVKTKGLIPILTKLGEVIGEDKDRIGELLPNVRAVTGAFAAMAGGTDELVKMGERFKDTTNVGTDAVKKQVKDITFVHQQLEVSLKNTWIRIGKQLEPIIRKYKELKLAASEAILVSLGGQKFDPNYKAPNTKQGGPLDKFLSGGGLEETLGLPGQSKDITGIGGPGQQSQRGSINFRKLPALILKTVAELQFTEKVNRMWSNTFDKLQKGYGKMMEQTEKLVQNLRRTFTGMGFTKLAGARTAIGGDSEIRGVFERFSGKVDLKTLGAEGIQKLAEASKGFILLGDQGKSSVGQILDQIVSVKKELTGEDVFGVVEAVKTGFGSDELSGALTKLWIKSIEAGEDELRKKGKEAAEKFYIEGLQNFSKKLEEVTAKAVDNSKISKEVAEKNMLSSKIIREAAQIIREAAGTPKEVEIKGDFSKFIDAVQEKSNQNKTGNVPGRFTGSIPGQQTFVVDRQVRKLPPR